MEVKNEYKRCFVAYLDILGFAERVRRSKNNQEEITLLLDSLRICNAFATRNKKVTNDAGKPRVISIQSRFFSDTVAFFLKENPRNIGHLFFIIRYTQDRLWERGLTVRGAITRGDMYLPNEDLKNNITLGPGIIKAYELESQIAIYPRIIISEKLYDYIQRKNIGAYPFACQGGRLVDYIRQDGDGVYFLDLLNKDIIRAEGEKPEKNDDMFSIVWESGVINKRDDIMASVDKCIDNGVNSRDEKIQQKYNWLRLYKTMILKDHT